MRDNYVCFDAILLLLCTKTFCHHPLVVSQSAPFLYSLLLLLDFPLLYSFHVDFGFIILDGSQVGDDCWAGMPALSTEIVSICHLVPAQRMTNELTFPPFYIVTYPAIVYIRLLVRHPDFVIEFSFFLKKN